MVSITTWDLLMCAAFHIHFHMSSWSEENLKLNNFYYKSRISLEGVMQWKF